MPTANNSNPRLVSFCLSPGSNASQTQLCAQLFELVAAYQRGSFRASKPVGRLTYKG